MITIQKSNVIFAITEKDLQNEAMERIRRWLTYDKIVIVKKRLAYGLFTDTDTVYTTIFKEMI
jgi:hypothetical protein